MFSPEQLNSLMAEIMSQFQGQGGGATSGCQKDGGRGSGVPTSTLLPAELLTIAGILGGVFRVGAILVDNRQTVQIRLDGTLRRKTNLEKTMDKIGGYSFDEVMTALMRHLSS